MYVFRPLSQTAWFVALSDLHAALTSRDTQAVQNAYTSLYAALTETNASDLMSAAARDLCCLDSSLATAVMASKDTTSRDLPAGLLEGARHDLDALLALLKRNWREEVCELVEKRVPPLAELAAASRITS